MIDRNIVNFMSVIMLLKMMTRPFMLQRDPALMAFRQKVKDMVDRGEIGSEVWNQVRHARTLREAVHSVENFI